MNLSEFDRSMAYAICSIIGLLWRRKSGLIMMTLAEPELNKCAVSSFTP